MSSDFRFQKPVDQKQMNGAYKVRAVGAAMVESKFRNELQLCLTVLDEKQRSIPLYFTMTDPKKVAWLLACGIFKEDGEDEIQLVDMKDQPLFWVRYENGRVVDMKPPKY